MALLLLGLSAPGCLGPRGVTLLQCEQPSHGKLCGTVYASGSPRRSPRTRTAREFVFISRWRKHSGDMGMGPARGPGSGFVKWLAAVQVVAAARDKHTEVRGEVGEPRCCQAIRCTASGPARPGAETDRRSAPLATFCAPSASALHTALQPRALLVVRVYFRRRVTPSASVLSH